ncbi:hypothetical protein [Aliiglaciecola lipolytica]|uniref:Lipoprotein n=1 Tax=Aliiglaciecola lipolytica E3 TaxID=1127673 RepID=K6XX68_9ALTE|nr:hypothetical protein [Aliiglaciecola lipolytica]GAC16241.1 hypothetical protein GLIP_3630 [Aliiglaciecola lipolytica E3]
MKKLAVILLSTSMLYGCNKLLTIDTLYAHCNDKKQRSIINYMVQFQVVKDISTAQLLELFDGEISQTESVDLCQCFVTKFKRQSVEVQTKSIENMRRINEQLKDELSLFTKKGVLGRMTYRQEYQRIESHFEQIPAVRSLIAQASENKFQQQRCL